MWAHRRGPALGPGALHCPRARSTRAFVPGTGCRRTAELGSGGGPIPPTAVPGPRRGRGIRGGALKAAGSSSSQAASLTASWAPGRLQGESHCVFARHLVLLRSSSGSWLCDTGGRRGDDRQARERRRVSPRGAGRGNAARERSTSLFPGWRTRCFSAWRKSRSSARRGASPRRTRGGC